MGLFSPFLTSCPTPFLYVSRFYRALYSFILVYLTGGCVAGGRLAWMVKYGEAMGFMLNLLWLLGRWIGLNLNIFAIFILNNLDYTCWFQGKFWEVKCFALFIFGSNWRIIGGFCGRLVYLCTNALPLHSVSIFLFTLMCCLFSQHQRDESSDNYAQNIMSRMDLLMIYSCL